MIARIWRGWAPKQTADDYQRHYASEVAEHLNQVAGFQGARLLRAEDGDEIMFTSITFFASLDAVRGFAGEEYGGRPARIVLKVAFTQQDVATATFSQLRREA